MLDRGSICSRMTALRFKSLCGMHSDQYYMPIIPHSETRHDRASTPYLNLTPHLPRSTPLVSFKLSHRVIQHLHPFVLGPIKVSQKPALWTALEQLYLNFSLSASLHRDQNGSHRPLSVQSCDLHHWCWRALTHGLWSLRRLPTPKRLHLL